MRGSGPHTRAAIVAVLLTLGADRALAQTTPDEAGSTPLAAWTLVGADIQLSEQWRGIVRAGHLADIDSRIVLGDIVFAPSAALQFTAGYVAVLPTASDGPGVSLTRAGPLWIPLRGRVAVDTRFLLERVSGDAVRASLRARGRLRGSLGLPAPALPRVFGSAELIASAQAGRIETRLQGGVTKSFWRWSLEAYWLQRRYDERRAVTGFGVTAYCRVGKSL